MPYPVTPAESDTLSGWARRGLDRALAVGGGLGGGGMHRVGACRGEAGAGPGVARVVSMTKTTEGRSGGGGVGARRSPAGRRGRLAQSVRVAGAACMHYTPPIPQGIRVWKPGDRRRAEAAPFVWFAAFSFAQHTARFMAGRVGTPARGCRSCPGLPTPHGLPPFIWKWKGQV